MATRPRSLRGFLTVQAIVIPAFAIAFLFQPATTSAKFTQGLTGTLPVPPVPVARDVPLRVKPLYDDPQLVSDAELAAVLKQVLPRFKPEHLRPNFVEHALRIWGVDATFNDKAVMSGAQMKDFLADHGKYLASWGAQTQPLLQEQPDGVSIRWGTSQGASVHHDHWLACLTEAGVHLHEPVFLPSRHQKSIGDVLQRSLRDFRVDERETEWSAMGFGLWIVPVKEWQTTDGRHVSFDMLAQRLLRGTNRMGVCHGTHRLYSMMLLVRLDDEYHILSPAVREAVLAHLRTIRDLIVASQFPDGHWSSEWFRGADALVKPVDDPTFRKVIATGHHLEWLSIAPLELHPPREKVRLAARWVIDTAVAQTPAQIQEHYTFYSHVGGALSGWRKTRPADFWRAWEAREQAAK